MVPVADRYQDFCRTLHSTPERDWSINGGLYVVHKNTVLIASAVVLLHSVVA